MDVALYGAHRDLALGGNLDARGVVCLLDGVEAGLGGLGGRHELRQEERALLEARAHLVEGGNEHLVDGVHDVVLGENRRDQAWHRPLAPGKHHGPCLVGGVGRGCVLGAGAVRGTRRAFCWRALCAEAVRRCRGRRGGTVAPGGVARHVGLGTLVLAGEHAPAVDHVHHALLARVDDAQVEPGRKRGRQKRGVYQRAERQAKADVRHAEHRAHARQLALDERDAVQDLAWCALVRGGRHAQAVHHHVLARDAGRVRGGHDPARHPKATLRRLGDALLVYGQGHQRAAVVRRYGDDGVHGLLLAVGGVDDGLARVAADGRLDGGRHGGVHLQRQVRDALEVRHQAAQRRGLVYLGQAGVHVQHLRAGVRLADGLLHHVVVVAGAQGLLHAALARGVDALADDAHVSGRQAHQALRACDREVAAHVARGGGAAGKEVPLARDVCRRGAAAAAHHRDAGVQHVTHGLAVLRGLDVVERDAVLHVGKAGVCLRHHRHAGPRQHAAHQRRHVLGAKRAVDAHDVGAERAEGLRRDLRRGAQEGAAVLVEGHGAEYGQVGALLCREHGRFGLCEVRHGLDDEQVRARGVGRAHLLRKQLVRVVERQRAHGFEERAGGADVRGDVARAGGLCAGDGGREDLLHRGRVPQLGCARAKGVGGDDLGARLHVRLVDLGYLPRVGEAQKLWHLAGRKAARLQLRAHGAVEQQEVLPREHAAQVVVLDAQGAVVVRAKVLAGVDGAHALADGPAGGGRLGGCVSHGRSFPWWRGGCRTRGRSSPRSLRAWRAAARRTCPLRPSRSWWGS